MVVVGASGFVGRAVCAALVARGAHVVGISRSGAPAGAGALSSVEWRAGDALEVEASWHDALAGAVAVISCIGGFGTSNADLEQVNGDVTVAVAEAAAEAGVPRFAFVSVHDYNFPESVTQGVGYFTGKRRAEASVLRLFGAGGAVLRPGFIYGDRVVEPEKMLPAGAPLPPQLRGTVSLPLGAVGEPLAQALDVAKGFGGVIDTLRLLPASDVLLAPPVSVDAVGRAAAAAALDDVSGVLTIDSIREYSP